MDNILIQTKTKTIMGETNFVIHGKNPKDVYHFIVADIGKAKYIYSANSYNKDYFYAEPDVKYELAAVYDTKNAIFYVRNGYRFGLNSVCNAELPSGCRYIGDCIKEATDYANSVIFPNYLCSIPSLPLNDAQARSCKYEAKRIILLNEDFRIEPASSVDEKIFLMNCCGFEDICDALIVEWDKDNQQYMEIASKYRCIKSYLDNPDSIVQQWEMRMAEGLRNLNDAKTVNLEFELNGQKETAKITPLNLLIRLYSQRDYFLSCEFVGKTGTELFNSFGLRDYQDNRHITCENISKITYGKKVIYDRDTA